MLTGAVANLPLLVVLPAADGDLSRKDGAKFYDRTSPAPHKSQLYVHRANHNFFNREWVNSEWQPAWPPSGPPPVAPEPPLLSRAAHERILEVYTTAFVLHTLMSNAQLPILLGRETPPGLPAADLRLAAEVAGALTVDDHEDADTAHNALGQKTHAAGSLAATELQLAQPGTTYFGDTRGLEATSPTPRGTFRSPLGTSRDVTGREVWVRAAEVYDGLAIPAGATGFQVGLEDDRGVVAFVPSGDLARPFDRRVPDLARFGVDRTKTLLGTVRFPADCFRTARRALDLAHVRAIVLRLDRPGGRKLAFDQLQVVDV